MDDDEEVEREMEDVSSRVYILVGPTENRTIRTRKIINARFEPSPALAGALVGPITALRIHSRLDLATLALEQT
jgi:hypothetical protein